MLKRSLLLLLAVLLTAAMPVAYAGTMLHKVSATILLADKGKGKSKAPKVKKAKRQPTKGKSKAPKVKKAKAGKNYTKRSNYP